MYRKYGPFCPSFFNHNRRTDRFTLHTAINRRIIQSKERPLSSIVDFYLSLCVYTLEKPKTSSLSFFYFILLVARYTNDDTHTHTVKLPSTKIKEANTFDYVLFDDNRSLKIFSSNTITWTEVKLLLLHLTNTRIRPLILNLRLNWFVTLYYKLLADSFEERRED